MEPIISPWIIYALHVYDNIYFTCRILMMCGLIIAPLLALFGSMEEEAYMMKYAKISAIVAVVCAIVLIIVPGKDTLIAMLAASYITPDNIQLVQGNVLEFIKQISEAVQNGK
jgi:hypothetical protein